MNIIKASATFVQTPIDPVFVIARAARTCYKSDGGSNEDEKLVRNLITKGHEAMLEFCDATARFTVDRGVSHEIVRHRIASYAQESTRYCNYSKDKFGNEITVIAPPFYEVNPELTKHWKAAMEQAERSYLAMIQDGASAQLARSVLPNSLKTEILVKMNMREWRHFFSLRADTPAHPQMREVAVPLLNECKERWPVLFEDILPEVIP